MENPNYNSFDVIYIENTDPFKNFVGGIPTYVRNAALDMKARGVEVQFVGSILGALPEESKSYFSRVISLSDKKIGHLKFTLKLFKAARKLLINKSSIIHCQRLMLCIPFIFSFKKYNLICTSHGIERNQIRGRKGWLQGFIYGIIEEIVVPRLKSLIVVDPHSEKYFKARFPSMASKVFRIPIGVEKSRFYPMQKVDIKNVYNIDNGISNLLFVGRIEYPKNLELILDAFAIVTRKGIKSKLIIAGEGRDKEMYESYCRDNKITNVVFIGGVPPTELVHLLNLCDLVLLSSFSEGSPTVVKESISCNTPVVSTNVGDVEEVIGDLEGCFIADFNKADYANAIIKALNVKDVDYQKKVVGLYNEVLFSKLYKCYSEVEAK